MEHTFTRTLPNGLLLNFSATSSDTKHYDFALHLTQIQISIKHLHKQTLLTDSQKRSKTHINILQI